MCRPWSLAEKSGQVRGALDLEIEHHSPTQLVQVLATGTGDALCTRGLWHHPQPFHQTQEPFQESSEILPFPQLIAQPVALLCTVNEE